MDKIDSVEGSPINTEALIGIIEHEQIITHYLLIFTGLQHYVTESYISWATGNLTRTISASFKGLMGKMCVLCIDVQVDSMLDSDSFSDEKPSFDT